MDVLAQKYQKQKNNLEYQKLLALEIPTLGVWDDHDYGVPDGGIEYPKKKESQKLFLDFLDEPLNSARRTQEGVYAYYDFGPKNQQIRIILLDGRYFRDQPGPDGDMLGEAQWAFLEKALYTSHARYNFILSGTQVLPEEHRFEKWSNFPKGKERLLKSIETYSPFIPVVFLSGDRHLAEISQWPQGALKIHYPLYDFTSSGLTHSYRTSPPEANRYRVGEFFTELNFGTVMIDWEKNQLHLQVRDQNANIVREVIF